MTVPATALFVYGTLMREALRRSLTGRDFPHCPATLYGYGRLSPAHLGGYSDITPRAGDHVDGILLENVDAESLHTLDIYEDVGRLYTRQPVHVMARGELVACEVYVGITPRR